MTETFIPKPRRVVPGHGTDMGRPLSRLSQVPFGLTDRDTGEVWYFAGSTTDPGAPFAQNPRLSWNSSPPGGGLFRPTVHAAFSEPVMADTRLRIFVRGGRLGFETVNTHVYDGPRWTAPHIQTWYSVRYELKVPTGGMPTPPRLAFETQPDW